MTDNGLPARLHHLSNGLRVVVIRDDVAPVVAVNLWYDVGSRHEHAGRTGLAHLVEHLMFEGSRNVAPGEHFRLVSSAGGTLNATTSTERTNYFETVPSGRLDLMLWLEADRMATVVERLTQELLDNQRDVVRNERRQRYDNVPYGTWLERMTALLFPSGHPYHHMPIGSMDDLAAASLDDVQGFLAAHYSPDNAVLSIVGAVEPNEAVARAEHYFGGIPASEGRPAPPAPDPLPKRAHGERRTYAERVPDEAVYLGYCLPPEGDPRLEHVELAFAVLGLGRACSLEAHVVQRDIAKRAGIFIDRRTAGASFGAVFAVARSGVPVEAVEGAIHDEFKRLADDGPTGVELARAKAMIERRWLDRIATPTGKADELSRATTWCGDPGRIAAGVDAQLAASADDVQAAMTDFVTEVAPVVLTYHPADTSSEAQ